MKTGIWAAAFLWAMPALAQEVDCDSAMNQGDLNQCAAMDYAEADAELNAVWKEAIGTMKEIDSYLEAEEKGAEDALRQSQRAWITYRDMTCMADGYRFHGGSAEPMVVSGCLATVTRNRTEELQGMIEGY